MLCVIVNDVMFNFELMLLEIVMLFVYVEWCIMVIVWFKLLCLVDMLCVCVCDGE